MRRRGFLASILAAGVAPAAIGSGILMPARKIIVPASGFLRLEAPASGELLEIVQQYQGYDLVDVEIGQIERFTFYTTPWRIA